MQYEGKITKVDFSPMVVINSYMELWVSVPRLGTTVSTERICGSEDALIEKFEFEKTEDGWDVSNVNGRECLLELRDGGYHFVRYTD